MSNSNPTSNIAWTEIPLDTVMNYFVKGFKVKEGEVLSHEYYLDQRKGRVVFKLVIQPAEPSRTQRP
jgi:hypothetical protein